MKCFDNAVRVRGRRERARPGTTLSSVAELKTKPTRASVSGFLDSIADDERRADCKTLVEMMSKATKAGAVMWGPAIIGFGVHEYTGASGKAASWFQAGFSPRKQSLTLYLMGGWDKALLDKLGNSKTSVSCLHIKRLDDVHRPTLQKLISASVKRLNKPKK
jgi:hypothetical protein